MGQMKLSELSETLIGSEIVKLGGEIREKIRQGEKIYNYSVITMDSSETISWLHHRMPAILETEEDALVSKIIMHFEY